MANGPIPKVCGSCHFYGDKNDKSWALGNELDICMCSEKRTRYQYQYFHHTCDWWRYNINLNEEALTVLRVLLDGIREQFKAAVARAVMETDKPIEREQHAKAPYPIRVKWRRRKKKLKAVRK